MTIWGGLVFHYRLITSHQGSLKVCTRHGTSFHPYSSSRCNSSYYAPGLITWLGQRWHVYINSYCIYTLAGTHSITLLTLSFILPLITLMWFIVTSATKRTEFLRFTSRLSLRADLWPASWGITHDGQYSLQLKQSQLKNAFIRFLFVAMFVLQVCVTLCAAVWTYHNRAALTKWKTLCKERDPL